MTAMAVLLAAVAAGLVAAGPTGGARRLARLRPAVSRPPVAFSATAACAIAAIAAVVVVGPPAGVAVGIVIGVGGPMLLGRLEPAAVRHQRQQLVRELPLLLDLLAACLAGGAALEAAATVVAEALPGPSEGRLRAVIAGLAVGMPPSEAWLALAGESADDPLAPAARLLARAADGGTPVSSAIGRLSTDARSAARAAGSQAARRAGVLVVAPLGLCFLPAFVLLGIVPVVAGLAAPLFRTF